MWLVLVGLLAAQAATPDLTDADGDGWCPQGADQDSDGVCTSAGEPRLLGDCDDAWIATNPSATEVCGDQRDNDCDGNLQDGPPNQHQQVFTDADLDGWGSGTALVACEPQAGQSLSDWDCDDADPNDFPGTWVGDNCDGESGPVDHDGDGISADDDCNDANERVAPTLAEVCFNGVDDDCDGQIDESGGTGSRSLWPDRDRDRAGDPATPTDVCADLVGHVRFLDNDDDCDDGRFLMSAADGDRDGLSGCDGDCDDTNAAIRPGLVDLAGNGIDEDCDGQQPPVPDIGVDTDTEDTDVTDTDADDTNADDTDAAVDTDVTDTDAAPPTPACGCSATHAPGGALVALLGLCAARLRRRELRHR